MSKYRPKNKTLGQVRYFSYFLQFPDGEEWVKSIPFVHELSYELPRTTFGKIPDLASSLLKKGECHWKDNNGVTHRVLIENDARTENWGVKRPGQFRLQR